MLTFSGELTLVGNLYITSSLGEEPLQWPVNQQAKLLPSDGAGGDEFGTSVAISADGNTVIIGANFKDNSPTSNNGAAYIFTRSGSSWTEQAILLASDKASSDEFGTSVALSNDGNTAIVGVPLSFASNKGAAYVFTRSGSSWSEQAKLIASDGLNSDVFGTSVSLSGDGNTAIIGAKYEDTSPNNQNGAAYVFTRSGSSWSEQAKLLASDASNTATFGCSVSLSNDGNTAAIGAYLEDTSPNTDNGAAYVFTRSGSSWSQQAKLLASDADNGDNFGYSVSISEDGNTVIVGAFDADFPGYTLAGAAYVFTRSGVTWSQQAKLSASDKASNDSFGYSVALSSSGNTAIVGAHLEDDSGSNAGAAYVFTRSGVTWSQQAKLLASDGANSYNFGNAVAMSSNGATTIIGSYAAPLTASTGYAYIFIAS